MSKVIEVTEENVAIIKRMVSKCTRDMSELTAKALLDNNSPEEYGKKSTELGRKLDEFVDYTLSKISK